MTPMGGQLDPQTVMAILKQLGLASPTGLGSLGGPGIPGAPPALSAGAPPTMPGMGPTGAPTDGPGTAPPGGPPLPPVAPPAPSAGGAPGVTPPLSNGDQMGPPFDPMANATPMTPMAGGSKPAARNPQTDMLNMTLGQAGYGGQERGLDRQMKMADELRNTATPDMRGNSRVQTAANPLEFAGAALKQIGGQRMADRTADKQQQMFEERMKRLREDMTASRGLGG